jgi:hypothetical protein
LLGIVSASKVLEIIEGRNQYEPSLDKRRKAAVIHLNEVRQSVLLN